MIKQRNEFRTERRSAARHLICCATGAPQSLRPATKIARKQSDAGLLTTTDQHESRMSLHEAAHHQSSAAQLLFDDSHVPRWSPLLVVYLPFGMLLALMRISLWVMGALLDLPSFRGGPVVSAYLAALGFKATWRDVDKIPKTRHVMVSNHSTPGDLMVLFQVRAQLCLLKP